MLYVDVVGRSPFDLLKVIGQSSQSSGLSLSKMMGASSLLFKCCETSSFLVAALEVACDRAAWNSVVSNFGLFSINYPYNKFNIGAPISYSRTGSYGIRPNAGYFIGGRHKNVHERKMHKYSGIESGIFHNNFYFSNYN